MRDSVIPVNAEKIRAFFRKIIRLISWINQLWFETYLANKIIIAWEYLADERKKACIQQFFIFFQTFRNLRCRKCAVRIFQFGKKEMARSADVPQMISPFPIYRQEAIPFFPLRSALPLESYARLRGSGWKVKMFYMIHRGTGIGSLFNCRFLLMPVRALFVSVCNSQNSFFAEGLAE